MPSVCKVLGACAPASIGLEVAKESAQAIGRSVVAPGRWPVQRQHDVGKVWAPSGVAPQDELRCFWWRDSHLSDKAAAG
eukprot:11184881-Lingulodinium_polyedra.AAC.1